MLTIDQSTDSSVFLFSGSIMFRPRPFFVRKAARSKALCSRVREPMVSTISNDTPSPPDIVPTVNRPVSSEDKRCAVAAFPGAWCGVLTRPNRQMQRTEMQSETANGYSLLALFLAAQRFFIASLILLLAAPESRRVRFLPFPAAVVRAAVPRPMRLSLRSPIALSKRSRSASNSRIIDSVSKRPPLLLGL